MDNFKRETTNFPDSQQKSPNFYTSPPWENSMHFTNFAPPPAEVGHGPEPHVVFLINELNVAIF